MNGLATPKKHFIALYTLALLILLPPDISYAMAIPSSERAQQAINRQTHPLTQALRARQLSLGNPVFFRIFKQEARLEIWVENQQGLFEHFKDYAICAASGQLGPKLAEGDYQSPEGFYYISASRFNPFSRYHLSLNMGYPNPYDQAHNRTGSALMIHGNCVSVGCYAMTDKGIEEIYTIAHAAISQGQPFIRVHAFPFEMNTANMHKYRQHRWINFWQNLEEGYRWFETHRRPPNVETHNQRYTFNADTE